MKERVRSNPKREVKVYFLFSFGIKDKYKRKKCYNEVRIILSLFGSVLANSFLRGFEYSFLGCNSINNRTNLLLSLSAFIIIPDSNSLYVSRCNHIWCLVVNRKEMLVTSMRKREMSKQLGANKYLIHN